MLALTLSLEKVDRSVPWPPWLIGGVPRLAAGRRNGSAR